MKEIILFTLITICAVSFSAQAKNHDVKLLTVDETGQTMIMSPGYLQIAKGDTVTFLPSDASHNIESVSIPKNAKKFVSKMGEKFSHTFNENGVYLYKCPPHFALGMLGVIQVGKAANIAQVQQDWTSINTGILMNKERVIAYFAQVK